MFGENHNKQPMECALRVFLVAALRQKATSTRNLGHSERPVPGVGVFSCFLSITLLLQCTAGHSSIAQHSTAQQGRPAHSKASLKVWQTSKSHSTAVHWNAHTHSLARPCSTAHSREVQHTPQCPQRTPEHGVLPALPNHILESFMCL